MTEGAPMEEMSNSQATLILENINARLPSEESEKGIISESGRLNKEGRKFADDVYNEFLERADGSYREVLSICKEAESLLHVDDENSRDMEMLKVLRSVKGKVVYHAHKTWAEKKMLLEKFGDESASNVMSYAKILKKDKEIDIYEEAIKIEKEKQLLDEKLRAENELLEQQNLRLMEQDIETITQNMPASERRPILEGLKSRLKAFSEKIMEPNTRGKIVAGAVSAVALTGLVVGYISHINEGGKINPQTIAKYENQSKATQISQNPSSSIEAITTQLPQLETPQVYDMYEEGYLASSAELPNIQNSTSQAEYSKQVQSEISLVTVSAESLRVVDSKHPLEQEVIKQEVEPNLVTIADVAPEVWVLNEKTKINKLCIEDLRKLFIASHEAGISLYLRSAFRSYADQKIAYEQATDKDTVALPGTSQHHTGLAIDFTTPEIGNVVDINANFTGTKAGSWLVENGWKYGFVLSYTNNHDGISNEDWHYFYVGTDLAKIWHDNQIDGNETDLFALQQQYIENSSDTAMALP